MSSTGRLSPDRTALVVVDFQEKLTPAVVDHAQVVRNALLLMRLARTVDLPVVLTTQYTKGLGPTIPEILSAADVAPLDKLTFGCFGDPAFTERLRALGDRRQLVVTGIESHICVAQTVFGALDAGYEVHVASDAVSSRTAQNREVGLARMQRAGAFVSSAEMVIYELLGRSDTAAFKTMLPYLKGGVHG
jgi:nicotinamidase-related amidase